MKMIFTTILAVAFALVNQCDAASFTLRSHEATYSMKELRKFDRSWSGIERAGGDLRYRFQNVCDGWTVEHQSSLTMEFDNARRSQMEYNYTSWEARDGKRLRFHSRMKENGELTESFSGDARFEQGKGVVVYAQPDGRRENLPADTIFPTTHLLETLTHAEQGEVVFSAPYFDGSGEDTFFNVDAVMVPFKGKPLHKVKDTTLAPSPTWEMQLSFHKADSQNSVAETQIGARYRKDGIATRLVQDYGDLVLVGDLVELTYLEEPDCN